MNYSSLFETATKAAAAVGFIFGLSFVAGLSHRMTFLSGLHAVWMTSLIDVQRFIADGLPFVAILLGTTLVLLLFLREITYTGKVGRILLTIMIFSFLSTAIIDLLLAESITLVQVVIQVAAASAVATCPILAWACHGYLHGIPSRHRFVQTLGSVLVALCFIPACSGYLKAYDLKFNKETAKEVVTDSGGVAGILVDVIAGKYVMLDCNVQYQIRIDDITSKYRVRRASGSCGAIY